MIRAKLVCPLCKQSGDYFDGQMRFIRCTEITTEVDRYGNALSGRGIKTSPSKKRITYRCSICNTLVKEESMPTIRRP